MTSCPDCSRFPQTVAADSVHTARSYATRRDATRQFLRVVSGGVNIDAANLLHQSVRPPVVRFPQQCVPFSINTLSLSRLRVPICAGKLSARETQLAFAEDRELSRGR